MSTTANHLAYADEVREISKSEIAQMTYDEIDDLQRSEMLRVIDAAFDCRSEKRNLFLPQASDRALRSLAHRARWHCRTLGY